MMPANKEHILIIKLGALGDFVQALGLMKAIRARHPYAKITLLTAGPFKALAEKCGYVDQVILDKKPRWYEWGKWAALKKTLTQNGFTRVYDLQNNDRTRLYFRLFPKNKRPEWIGTAKGCSHCNLSPERTAGHAFDGHRQTLALAGIEDITIDDFSWARAEIKKYGLPKHYALIVPGCAPSRPEKQWPARYYGELCSRLVKKGITPVIIGTETERHAAETIKEICAEAVDLIDKTDFIELAVIARHAKLAIGNDTGPMHIIAATGCPALTLFSSHSNPVKHAPRGKHTDVIQCGDLGSLSVDKVIRHINAMP